MRVGEWCKLESRPIWTALRLAPLPTPTPLLPPSLLLKELRHPARRHRVHDPAVALPVPGIEDRHHFAAGVEVGGAAGSGGAVAIDLDHVPAQPRDRPGGE